MQIIPLGFKIQRDTKTGKKVYTDLNTNKSSMKPSLPKDWPTYHSKSNDILPSYAIRPDNNLVVIDCDSQEATEAIDNILVPSAPGTQAHYIAISDKEEKHFYFEPTDYYRNSLIYKKTRKALGKIDVLHGNALIFTPCALNTTKEVQSGALTELTPIPNNIVDYLVSLLKESATSSADCDYSPILSYLAPTIEQSLALYGRSQDYRDLQNMMALITPSRFKHALKPDFHPDRVPDGEGIDYLQAITSKIGADPSISLALHAELLTLITQRLWTSPLPAGDLKSHIDSITSQKYSTSGKKIFVYNKHATAHPLVAINKNPYMPIYRTLDDNYIIAKPSGGVELIRGIQNFKRAMLSKNYSLMIDSAEVKNGNYISKATENLDTATIKTLAYQPSGAYQEDGSLYYNTYTPTKFLGIIRGEYLQERTHTIGSIPTIDAVLKNITCDHPQQLINLEQFLAHKLKTLDYSPIVFQIMGNRGVGKGLFMMLLDIITDSTTAMKIGTSNAQFNADTAGRMFVNEDEGIVTAQVINTLKELSGGVRTRIEAKGVDAYMARNIATYVCTTNKPIPLAEVIDDRRFVTLSSFRAKKLNILDVDTKIAIEAEEWCLRLRDTKLVNPKLYTDANEWHDDIHKNAFLEKSETTEHMPSKIASLIFTLRDMTGDEIKQELKDILGEDVHYYLTRATLLSIPLYKSTNPTRVEDDVIIPKGPSASDLKAVGLGEHLSEDKSSRRYNKRHHLLRLQLSEKQAKSFIQSGINVEPIEGIY